MSITVSLMPSGLLYFNSLERTKSNRRDVWLVLLLSCAIEIPVVNANSVDPDQTPRSVDYLGLHCLSISIVWASRINGLITKMFISSHII